jgi:F-type H+-transporting ATPase subunit b
MAEKTTTSLGAGLPDGVGHPKTFPPLDATTFAPQLFWLVIAFVLLYVLLSRKALPRIGQVIEERRERIDRDLGEAERLKTETEAALKTYEAAHAEARSRAQAIAKETRDKLATEAEQARHKVDAELNNKLAETEKQIAATKARALAGVNQIAADTAGAIVAKLIGQEPTPDELKRALSAPPGE